MPFSICDFQNPIILTQLRTIMNDKLNYPITQKFSDLTPREQKKYNIEMNKYIFELPDELFLEQIEKDFNEVAFDYLTNPKFRPEDQKVSRLQQANIELTKEQVLDDELTNYEISILKVN
jgi:hypothetical protein